MNQAELFALGAKLDREAWRLFPKLCPHAHGDRASNPNTLQDVDREKGGRVGSSCWMVLRGRYAGFWRHVAAGKQGNALGFLVYCGECRTMPEAVDWAMKFLGEEAMKAPAPAPRPRERIAREPVENAKAFALWLKAEPQIRGTLADVYLRSRGLGLHQFGKQPSALRFHPEVWHSETGRRHPALLALVTGANGRPLTVHRIYLEPDGRKLQGGKAKKFYSSPVTGLVRLWRGIENGKPRQPWQAIFANPALAAAETVLVTEGVENALTAMLAKPEYRIGAALSLGLIGHLRLPPGLGRLIVVADDDDEAARRTLDNQLQELLKQCRNIFVARPPKGAGDLNDIWKRTG